MNEQDTVEYHFIKNVPLFKQHRKLIEQFFTAINLDSTAFSNTKRYRETEGKRIRFREGWRTDGFKAKKWNEEHEKNKKIKTNYNIYTIQTKNNLFRPRVQKENNENLKILCICFLTYSFFSIKKDRRTKKAYKRISLQEKNLFILTNICNFLFFCCFGKSERSICSGQKIKVWWLLSFILNFVSRLYCSFFKYWFLFKVFYDFRLSGR